MPLHPEIRYILIVYNCNGTRYTRHFDLTNNTLAYMQKCATSASREHRVACIYNTELQEIEEVFINGISRTNYTEEDLQ